ncbi:MAG: substrate-binding domain-containing protein [Planctomycetia bacterium]
MTAALTATCPPRCLVAVILDSSRHYDRRIIGGVAQYAREHGGWSLYVEEDPLQKLPDLHRWHGQGIIANFDDRKVAAAMRGLAIPVVGVGGGYGWHDRSTGVPYIYTDNAKIGRIGAEHLLACGFETLAFYGHPRTVTSGWSDEREAAFTAAVRAAGRPCRVFSGRHVTARRWEELQQELQAWIAGLPRPVGLMACNDLRARHVLEACRALGLRVPHAVSVLGVDNDEMICSLTAPPLSSIDHSTRRIGYEAAAVLDRLLQQAGRPRRRTGAARQGSVVVPPIGVVARASTDVTATHDELVLLTLRRLREHPARRPDISAIAAEACVSRSTLENRFRAVIGRSIHEEFVRMRIAGLRRLITASDLPLKTVAARAGFPSVQYMTTFLHRHTGLTPARMRSLEGSGRADA